MSNADERNYAITYRSARKLKHLGQRLERAPLPSEQLNVRPNGKNVTILGLTIRSDRLLGEHGIERENARGRKEFEHLMEARRLEESDEKAAQPFRRGWYIGGEAFRKAMIAKMERKLKGHPVAQVRRESAEIKAERILAEELKAKGWTRRELVRRRKSDPEKLALGAHLRQETTLRIKQIARLVTLGSYGNSNARLHEFMKTNGNKGHAGIRRRQSKHAKVKD